MGRAVHGPAERRFCVEGPASPSAVLRLMATENLQRLREPRPGTTARRHSTPRLFAPSASISSDSVEEYEVSGRSLLLLVVAPAWWSLRWIDPWLQVVFTEDKLGLTLRPEGVYHDDGRRSVRTVVKSAATTNQIHVSLDMPDEEPRALMD